MAHYIGIGITTHNRRDVLVASLAAHQQFLPPGAKLVVVDDASASPTPESDFTFKTNVGIARAKNKCLELLADCEHIFLFDDDAYPVADAWWAPYVSSPEPHLMRIFHDLAGRRKMRDIDIVFNDGRHVAYTGARGAMLYAHRSVLPIVGGMDPGYGRWGYEHVDWSRRIHNAGLTTWPFADIAESGRLVRCEDEFETVDRSVPDLVRERLVKANRVRYRQTLDARTTTYHEYREPRDVVITSLFTSQVDPQRGVKWAPDVSQLDTLRASLGAQPLVVLHDELLSEVDDEVTEFVRYPQAIQPYFQRHVSAWQYLRDHPEIRYVWCVDGTDVEMYRDPFADLMPGTLYLGCEPVTVGDDWMRRNHRAKHIAEWLNANAGRQLLNAGLIGGDRATVMAFLHELIREYGEQHARVFHREDRHDHGVGDMAVLNYVAYQRFWQRLRTGPAVCTLFRAEQTREQAPAAAWRHK